MNTLLLLMITTFLVILTIGTILNKLFSLPWMFSVVIYGIVLSSTGLFASVIEGESFQLLAKLGMLFFLFTIGLDLNLREIKKLGKLIVLGNLLLVLVEASLLAIIFYFFFPAYVNHSFIVAFFSGLAFGTVGEVVLLTILKEFGVEKNPFGQLENGNGVFYYVF